ncbi:hypothetical protein BDY19DRAFT_566017 [Irpex rosettiformis]|uniref:Uncharacterized protein n=1 Tax=Irpex rosettiformis TaxID=378272 RepID=A0ACB8UC40_9APHY|nr:hypothetical protein BDY19DRAFT_566017 [Irpex rosettiformis]
MNLRSSHHEMILCLVSILISPAQSWQNSRTKNDIIRGASRTYQHGEASNCVLTMISGLDFLQQLPWLAAFYSKGINSLVLQAKRPVVILDKLCCINQIQMGYSYLYSAKQWRKETTSAKT